jgi:hypothetical protein
MTPPDFIIAGAMRSGTTALAAALSEHQSLFLTTPKEPSFFAVGRGSLEFSGPGDQWFARQNSADWQAYQQLFAPAAGRVAGEASAMYLAIPGVAGDIARRCPEAKIVFVLRDPVARAHSAWLYLRGQGREDLADFAVALDAERSRRKAGYGPIWWYVGASRYHLGLREYYDAFPRSSILVQTTEDLRADPRGVVARVCRFLGVEEDVDPQALSRDVNASGVPRAEWLARLLYPSDRLRAAASRIAPTPVRQWVRRARAAAVRPPEGIPGECRRRLAEELSEVADEVAALTGLDTTRWTGPVTPPAAGPASEL